MLYRPFPLDGGEIVPAPYRQHYFGLFPVPMERIFSLLRQRVPFMELIEGRQMQLDLRAPLGTPMLIAHSLEHGAAPLCARRYDTAEAQRVLIPESLPDEEPLPETTYVTLVGYKSGPGSTRRSGKPLFTVTDLWLGAVKGDVPLQSRHVSTHAYASFWRKHAWVYGRWFETDPTPVRIFTG